MAVFSVIVPVYNVETYLKECLDSITNQSFKDFEVICVNDGSTDKSAQILAEYSQQDSRFKIISQENKGTGIARNTALKLGENSIYTVFVDPDDWIEPDAFLKIYRAFEETNAEVIEFNYKEYNEYSGKTQNHSIAEKIKKKLGYKLNDYYNLENVKKGCLSSLNLYNWSRAYKTEFIKKIKAVNADTRCGEDHIFAQMVVLNAKRIYYLNEYLYTYRCHEGSSVNKFSKSHFCIFENIRLLKEYLLNNNLFEELQEDFIRYKINIMACHYNNINDENRAEYESLCKQNLTKKDYKKMLAIAQRKNSILEFIFSIKNKRNNGIKSKIVTIMGCKIEIKPHHKINGKIIQNEV